MVKLFGQSSIYWGLHWDVAGARAGDGRGGHPGACAEGPWSTGGLRPWKGNYWFLLTNLFFEISHFPSLVSSPQQLRIKKSIREKSWCLQWPSVQTTSLKSPGFTEMSVRYISVYLLQSRLFWEHLWSHWHSSSRPLAFAFYALSLLCWCPHRVTHIHSFIQKVVTDLLTTEAFY